MIKFHKVSLEQWLKDCKVIKYDKNGKEENIPLIEGIDKELYNEIQLPKRATKGSAGYDIYSPFHFELEPGETKTHEVYVWVDDARSDDDIEDKIANVKIALEGDAASPNE